MKDQDYTFSIFKMVIDNELEKKSSESLLDSEVTEAERDQLVWEMATKIYTYSGHKVELPMVRDLIDIHLEERKSYPSHKKRLGSHTQKETPSRTNVDFTRSIFLKTCSVICKCTEVSAHRVNMASRIDELAQKREFLKILNDLEAAFDIQLPDQAVGNIQTVKNLVDFIGYQMSTNAGRETTIAI
ncbi:hypothetical protein [Acaryochloris sp. IP29b_bin.137]|uniref:hypothetical protein n=1 Tax=Acaryochloris sp. IP29b_bin.137 TaxID=2969217 RepID=UPI00261C6983|nr:hypothetical protein [Acaryochloris sp. IP29b_bin.137]